MDLEPGLERPGPDLERLGCAAFHRLAVVGPALHVGEDLLHGTAEQRRRGAADELLGARIDLGVAPPAVDRDEAVGHAGEDVAQVRARLSSLIEQPGMFDHGAGLCGDRLDQLDLLGAELQGFTRLIEGDQPDESLAIHDGHHQHELEGMLVQVLPVGRGRSGLGVVDDEGLLAGDHLLATLRDGSEREALLGDGLEPLETATSTSWRSSSQSSTRMREWSVARSRRSPSDSSMRSRSVHAAAFVAASSNRFLASMSWSRSASARLRSPMSVKRTVMPSALG